MEIEKQQDFLFKHIQQFQQKVFQQDFDRDNEEQLIKDIDCCRQKLVKGTQKLYLELAGEEKNQFIAKYNNLKQEVSCDSQLSSYCTSDFQPEDFGEEVNQESQSNDPSQYYSKINTPIRYKIPQPSPEMRQPSTLMPLSSPEIPQPSQISPQKEVLEPQTIAQTVQNTSPQIQSVQNSHRSGAHKQFFRSSIDDTSSEPDYIEPFGGFVDEINEVNRAVRMQLKKRKRKTLETESKPYSHIEQYTPIGGFAQDIRDLNSQLMKRRGNVQMREVAESSNPKSRIGDVEMGTPQTQKTKINADNKYMHSRVEDQNQEVGEVFEFPRLLGQLDVEPTRQKRNKTQKRLSFNESLVSFYHLSQTTIEDDAPQSEELKVDKEDLLQLASSLNQLADTGNNENSEQNLFDACQKIQQKLLSIQQDQNIVLTSTPQAVQRRAQFQEIVDALEQYIHQKNNQRLSNMIVQNHQEHQQDAWKGEAQRNDQNDDNNEQSHSQLNGDTITRAASNGQSQAAQATQILIQNTQAGNDLQRQSSVQREPLKNITQQTLNNTEPLPSDSPLHTKQLNWPHNNKPSQHPMSTPLTQDLNGVAQNREAEFQNPSVLKTQKIKTPHPSNQSTTKQLNSIQQPNIQQVAVQQADVQQHSVQKDGAEANGDNKRFLKLEQEMAKIYALILKLSDKDKQGGDQKTQNRESREEEQLYPIQRLNFQSKRNTEEQEPADDLSMVANHSQARTVYTCFPNDSPNQQNYKYDNGRPKVQQPQVQQPQPKPPAQPQETAMDWERQSIHDVNMDRDQEASHGYSFETAEDFVPSPNDTVTVSNREGDNLVQNPQRESSKSINRQTESQNQGSSKKRLGPQERDSTNNQDVIKKLQIAVSQGENQSEDMSQSVSLMDNLNVQGSQDNLNVGTSKNKQKGSTDQKMQQNKNGEQRQPKRRQQKRNGNGKGPQQFLGAVYPSPNLQGGTMWVQGEEDAKQVRRSTRQRFAPIEYWRGESITYERKHHALPTVKEVHRRTSPDPVKLFKQQMYDDRTSRRKK